MKVHYTAVGYCQNLRQESLHQKRGRREQERRRRGRGSRKRGGGRKGEGEEGKGGRTISLNSLMMQQRKSENQEQKHIN